MMRPEPTQGPEWLYELLFSPPLIVEIGIYALAVGILGVAYIGYRRVGITDEVIEEVGCNVLIVICAWGLTAALVKWGAFSYLVDVLVGGIGGFLLAKGGFEAVRRVFGEGGRP